MVLRLIFLFFLFAFLVVVGAGTHAFAEDVVGLAASGTHVRNEPAQSEPWPRFMSLKRKRVVVRVGPGSNYPIAWIYHRIHFPIKVVGQFGTWRQIEDETGEPGWIYVSDLSFQRTAFVKPDALIDSTPKSDKEGERSIAQRGIPMYATEERKRVKAYLQPKVVVFVRKCLSQECEIKVSGYIGWVERQFLWGSLTK